MKRLFYLNDNLPCFSDKVNPFEVQEWLHTLGLTKLNNSKPITASYIRAYLKRMDEFEQVEHTYDWWVIR